MKTTKELSDERIDTVMSMIDNLEEDKVVEWIDSQPDKNEIDAFLAGFWGIVPDGENK